MFKAKLSVFRLLVPLFLLLGGCAAMQVEREVRSGRSALRTGSPKAATPHFEAAARLEPDYITNTRLRIGIWSYVGRSYYEAGDKAKALESFRRARREHSTDYFAQIYLGTLMATDGQRAEGVKQLEAGLKGLHEWVNSLPGRFIDGKYWDPGKVLRGRMEETLGMLRSEKVDWSKVEADVLWLGQKFDDEIEEVRRQKRDDVGGGRRSGAGISP